MRVSKFFSSVSMAVVALGVGGCAAPLVLLSGAVPIYSTVTATPAKSSFRIDEVAMSDSANAFQRSINKVGRLDVSNPSAGIINGTSADGLSITVNLRQSGRSTEGDYRVEMPPGKFSFLPVQAEKAAAQLVAEVEGALGKKLILPEASASKPTASK